MTELGELTAAVVSRFLRKTEAEIRHELRVCGADASTENAITNALMRTIAASVPQAKTAGARHVSEEAYAAARVVADDMERAYMRLFADLMLAYAHLHAAGLPLPGDEPTPAGATRRPTLSRVK